MESIILCGINGGIEDSKYGKDYYDNTFKRSTAMLMPNIEVYGDLVRFFEKFIIFWAQITAIMHFTDGTDVLNSVKLNFPILTSMLVDYSVDTVDAVEEEESSM